jgi:hypothetical protein
MRLRGSPRRWLAALAVVAAAGAVAAAVWPGAAALLNVTAAKLTTQSFTNVVGTATLLPRSDKHHPSGADWQNQANQTCGTGTNEATAPTTCAASIDEDIDNPSDSDYIRSKSNANPNKDIVEFHLTDAPSDLNTLVEIKLRVRARKDGGQAGSVTVEVVSGSSVIGSLSQSLTTGFVNYETTITGLSLNQSQVNSLFVRVKPDSQGNTMVLVSTINLDITYLR